MLVTRGIIITRSQVVIHPRTSYNERNLTPVPLGNYKVHCAML